jgi:aryl-alcohol dehydrogenase-like predicted oxidoreductase
MRSNFVLGTANFGTKYGISNGGSSLHGDDVKKIVGFAEKSGLFQFDTAPSYGNAENLLGLSLKHPRSAGIFTKISSGDSGSVSKMLQSVRRSLVRTGASKFSGIYLHDESVLETTNPKEVILGIKELLDSGLTERVGISVYSEDALIKAKNICPELNLFQVPENICDRRLYNSEIMKKLALSGDLIYVRSIFLQGLLLMKPKNIPKEFFKILANVEKLIEFAKLYNISREALCLSYARKIPWATGLIIGVASVSQLEKLLEPETALPQDFELHIPSIEEEFLDPRNWPRI